MENSSFPRWSAPIIGPIVGGAIAIWVALEQGLMSWLGALALGAALGLAAGLLIWLNDAPRANAPRPIDPARFDPEASPELGRYELHFLWIVAVLSVLLFWVPLIGLVMGIIAFAVNYRYQGGPKIVSSVGLMLSLLLTCAIIGVQFMAVLADR
jgi:MFS family permease